MNRRETPEVVLSCQGGTAGCVIASRVCEPRPIAAVEKQS